LARSTSGSRASSEIFRVSSALLLDLNNAPLADFEISIFTGSSYHHEHSAAIEITNVGKLEITVFGTNDRMR
jgi:hypothetical protein